MKNTFGRNRAAQKLEILLKDNPSARRKISRILSSYTHRLLMVTRAIDPATVNLCMVLLRNWAIDRVNIVSGLTDDIRSYARNIVVSRYRVYRTSFESLTPTIRELLAEEKKRLTSSKKKV